MVIIRRFERDDFLPVFKIIYETFPERYDPQLFIHLYETFPDGFMVAEENKRIIGFIIGVRASEETFRILLLAVTPDMRKRGVGSSLLKKFLNIVILRGSREVRLEVRTDNKRAIEFYKKHGFQIIDFIPELYQNGEDAYIMIKSL